MEKTKSMESILGNAIDGEECPLCHYGTVEHSDGFVNCTGECGASVELLRNTLPGGIVHTVHGPEMTKAEFEATVWDSKLDMLINLLRVKKEQ